MARILIVEDQLHLRKLYTEELEAEGHEVVTVKSCKTAGRLLDRFLVDLVILDLVLDEENSLALVDHIVNKDRTLPIIIFTAYPGYKDDFHAWAAARFLTKSSDFTELKETVNQLLAAEPSSRAGVESEAPPRNRFNAS